MKALSLVAAAFLVFLVAMEYAARLFVAAFCIIFFGYWGYKTAEDIHAAWRRAHTKRRVA